MSKKLNSVLLLLVFSLSATAQSVTGKITDSRGMPVFSASVYLLNTNIGTFTDSTGTFTLGNVPHGKYIMQVSAIGFATAGTVINTSDNKEIMLTLAGTAKLLDNVVVTAQKQEELLQNVPLSITALSSREVQQYRLWNSKEVTAIAPNVYSANSGDDRNVTSIRGITTTSYDPAVATYVDGVNQFNLDTYIANLIDVERIEILRGPQGTLYGRNAMGGVINIITKQPTNRTSGFVELNAGNFSWQRYSAGIRAPIVKNKLFIGVAGMYNKRNGFYTNEFTNTSYDKQHSFTGNYYVKFVANPAWAFTLNFKHHNNRNNGPFPLTFGDETFTNPFKLTQNATATMHDNTVNSSLSVNHVGKSFNFSSQTAYQFNHRIYDAPLDGDFSPIDGVTIINDYGDKWNRVKAFTQEFKFTSPAATSASDLKWTAGTYFFRQDNPTKQATHFGEDAQLLGLPDNNFTIINTNEGKSTGAALYGQVSYPITHRLQVIGGLRYDYEKKKYSVSGEYQKDPDPAFVIRPDTSATVDYSAVSPKLGLSYASSDNNTVYVVYSRGYRTGGFSQLSTDPSQPPLYPYKPEYSNNIEAGIKNTFLQNKIRLNVAAFFTHVNDAQVPTLILPDAITITRNAGKLSSKGVDLEVAATPVSSLEINYAFGYTDATYKTLKLSQNGAEVNLAGKRQVFTPDITSMLAAQYAYSIGTRQLQIVVRGEWHYLGTQYFDLANTIKQSGYSLLNARAGISAKSFEIMLWGKNLGDKKYIAYAYDFGAMHLGDPKTYGLTVSVRL